MSEVVSLALAVVGCIDDGMAGGNELRELAVTVGTREPCVSAK